MPRATATDTKRKRTPRPKKKVVAFLVSDEQDDHGFLVKTQDEIGPAMEKIWAKMPSYRKADGMQDWMFQIRCVAEDGTIKCAILEAKVKVAAVKVSAPPGMTL